ncbi:glycosyltransferase family 4 protein [Romeria aff. gracilis LEGE 07310]|uniref:Glycosyltransferase family 4 protein n=1 Tax=Vasconcelosia minhoensis LEGE 07310 TaxID=915328 RepID=A0A8J7DN95_9CYAN|nr:glycosyltransferase family 4 protein [Romeria gracilis]MBE9079941.1 glycosyltransferase family 4 protein [Romeria aff. gracilis LEGE 07310]
MRVAFVVQRCGIEVNGGAEYLCRRIAQQMAKHWDTEVLTTCALDYMTWKNHYPSGVVEEGGTRIRRFPVDQPRNVALFNRRSQQLQAHLMSSTVTEQELWMKSQGPRSRGLSDYIQANQQAYDAFIFFGYLYATTYFNLPQVKEKAYLVPCAHDEWAIYMSMWNVFFQQPRGFVFNTVEEREFLRSRFPHISFEGAIAGVGVEPPDNYSAERFRQQFRVDEPFLLYIGRVDASKGCGELFQNFIALRENETRPRKLVLIGRSVIDIPEHPDIVSLGFVEERTKWDALAACDILVMPSPYESLSMVLLEAWLMRKPVLVNSKCKVLVGQCRRAQGGLWYENAHELITAIKELDSPNVLRKLGIQGYNFLTHGYSWQKIEQDYLNLITAQSRSNS